jgi:hypothetical protein
LDTTDNDPVPHYGKLTTDRYLTEGIRHFVNRVLPLTLTVDPLFGYAFDRKPNEKVLLVCPSSSKQEQWFDLECVNIHSGKAYKMMDCNKKLDAIPYNIVFPSQFARLLVEYRQHPEAKSLAPDGSPCKAETSGLLKRAHVIAGEFRYVGKGLLRRICG